MEEFGIKLTYLDTHALAWLYSGKPQKLSKAAWSEIQKSDPVISPMVILELQLLFEIGRAKAPAAKVVEVLSKDVGLSVSRLPFAQVMESALDLTWTRDPFDRLIVAHASASDAPLITRDETILRNYKHAIW